MTNDKQRKRLVELIIQGNNLPCGNGFPWEDDYCKGCEYEGNKDCRVAQLADYLLEKGAITLPCKVGQKLYTVYTRGINDKFIQESTVSKIVFDDWDGLRIIKKVVDEKGCCFFYDVDQEQLNKTTFFSKKEAEKHL